MTVKIAFISHSNCIYGASRSLLNLIEGLRDYDVESFVIMEGPGELAGLLEKAGAKVAYVPVRWWVHTHERVSAYVRTKLALRALLRGRIKSALCALLGEKWFIKDVWEDSENITRIVEILKAWDVDLVQSNSSVIPAGYYASRALNIPHIWHLREFWENYNFHVDLGNARTRKIVNSSEACIAVSNSVAEYYFDTAALGIKRVIYNGVLGLAEFNELREKNVACKKSGNDFIFGLIGNIQPSKGFDVAIRALSLVKVDFPFARLAIAGGDNFGTISALKNLANELDVASNIDWMGEFDDPFKLYVTIDALLMCSRKEAMGRVTVEAFAACKPVIGFDGAGTSELITHGKTGLLYRGEHEALASAMRIYLNDPSLARNMGMAAWEEAHARFTSEEYARQFYQVIEELLNGRSPA